MKPHISYTLAMQAERGVAHELAEARADWQASLAEDARELQVLPTLCFLPAVYCSISRPTGNYGQH